nr:acyloxyacyl hydrolase [uncultured Flavobacterium sp.]
MKKTLLLSLAIMTMISNQAHAQYSYGDKWYNNPLGFEPLKLHTSMGFIIPAAAVGTCLLLTKNNPSLKQRLSVYNEIGMSWGYKYPKTFLPQNNTGINYQLRKFMSVGIEFDVVLARDDFNSTTGFALRPFARFYPVNQEKWRLYFESGGGLIYTLTEFPKPTEQDGRLGLKLNGITKYGIGSEINLSKSTALMFGMRHIHISNGNAKGEERNPSHDSNGFFLGLSHRL